MAEDKTKPNGNLKAAVIGLLVAVLTFGTTWFTMLTVRLSNEIERTETAVEDATDNLSDQHQEHEQRIKVLQTRLTIVAAQLQQSRERVSDLERVVRRLLFFIRKHGLESPVIIDQTSDPGSSNGTHTNGDTHNGGNGGGGGGKNGGGNGNGGGGGNIDDIVDSVCETVPSLC